MSKRRVFSREFKIEAVNLVTQQGYGVSQAAESLGIGANLLAEVAREVRRARPGSVSRQREADGHSVAFEA